MSEWTRNDVQTIQPGGVAVFDANPVKSTKELVWERDDTGLFGLKGYTPHTRRCYCQGEVNAVYLVDFAANVAVPTGETAGEISVAITLEGVPIPASMMITTPAAVEEYQNISRAIMAQVRKGCCASLAIENTSTIPILMKNANIIFSRPDLAR